MKAGVWKAREGPYTGSWIAGFGDHFEPCRSHAEALATANQWMRNRYVAQRPSSRHVIPRRTRA